MNKLFVIVPVLAAILVVGMSVATFDNAAFAKISHSFNGGDANGGDANGGHIHGGNGNAKSSGGSATGGSSNGNFADGGMAVQAVLAVQAVFHTLLNSR